MYLRIPLVSEVIRVIPVDVISLHLLRKVSASLVQPGPASLLSFSGSGLGTRYHIKGDGIELVVEVASFEL